MLYELQEAFAGADRLTMVEKQRLEKKIEALEKENHMQLDTLQRQAVMDAVENGIFLLSGGPGTGKTTTINMMIHYFEDEGCDIFLAAPTGRLPRE